jgi:hypothetical protein
MPILNSLVIFLTFTLIFPVLGWANFLFHLENFYRIRSQILSVILSPWYNTLIVCYLTFQEECQSRIRCPRILPIQLYPIFLCWGNWNHLLPRSYIKAAQWLLIFSFYFFPNNFRSNYRFFLIWMKLKTNHFLCNLVVWNRFPEFIWACTLKTMHNISEQHSFWPF